MAEVKQTNEKSLRYRKVRHRGRLQQVSICFGKLLRMFVYQNDWKVLPMAALIAALVSMVVRRDCFLTMEGTLKGAFAFTCVAIWNGCFNSIQVICRERSIIKREHRSGMHISSYVLSHMLYQALLCLAQTILTLYVCQMMGVQFPADGLFTSWLIADLAITIFLITYASDMLSLWVSSVAHSTTTAMTVMPFVLIFQLVFSGGIFSLPQWCQSLSDFTISNYGLKCIAAQADYNEMPMVTAWNTLQKMRDKEIGGTVTLGQVLDFLTDENNATIQEIRAKELGATFTVGQAWEWLQKSESWEGIQAKEIDAHVTVGQALDYLQHNKALEDLRNKPVGDAKVGDIIDLLASSFEGTDVMEKTLGGVFTLGEAMKFVHIDELVNTFKDVDLGGTTTIGALADRLAANPDVQKRRDQSITVSTSVGKLIELIGEEKVERIITREAAKVSQIAAYNKNEGTIISYWMHLLCFILGFAALAVLSLESIDRDKR